MRLRLANINPILALPRKALGSHLNIQQYKCLFYSLLQQILAGP